MSKHLIEDMCWKSLSIQRPFQIETVWETLAHLAAVSPRGAVVWEVRGCMGQVRHLLGADRQYIDRIEETFRAHCQVQFREVGAKERLPAVVARQLKVTNVRLSLNTAITDAVVRAGLAAMTADKSGAEIILQVILGRGFAPSPTPADIPDPSASWLNVMNGRSVLFPNWSK